MNPLEILRARLKAQRLHPAKGKHVEHAVDKTPIEKRG